MFGRRLLVLQLVHAAIGVPAGVLRAACAGKSCPADVVQARVPFCPLPTELKAKLAAGFREGRSPDVMAVTGGDPGAPRQPAQLEFASFAHGARRGDAGR